MKIQNRHDNFCKKFLCEKEDAISFAENYFPEELRSLIDVSDINIDFTTCVDEKLKNKYSDIIYKIRVKGRETYLYILIDHKSEPDSIVAYQLAKYSLEIAGRDLSKRKKLTPVIPCVLYHGTKEWKIGLKLSDLYDFKAPEIKKYLLDFEYFLVDMSKYNDDEITGTPKLSLGLMTLKHIFDNPGDLENVVKACFGILKQIWENPEGRIFLEAYLGYLFTTELSVDPVKEVFDKLTNEGGDFVMSTVEKLMKEGEKRGIKKGKMETARNMLKENIDKKLIAKITGLSEKEIDKLKLEMYNRNI